MKAAVYNRYGPPDVLEIKTLPDPVPSARQIRVRVQASTVCAPDWRFRSANPWMIRLMTGLTRPAKDRILGMEFAGVVDSVGDGVTRFKAGDAVFGTAGMAMGAHAELLCVPDNDNTQMRPARVPPEQAAALPYAGVTALHFLGKAGLKPGQDVLIYGASGGVGSTMVQLAKHLGARVTGVASARNQDFVRSLGADAAIDYVAEDFSAGGARFDVVADTVGKAMWGQCRRAVKPGGAIVQVSPYPSAMTAGIWTHMSGRVRVYSSVAVGRPGDIAKLADLAATGAIKPPIEARFPLTQIVEAHRLSESGRKRGHVAVMP